MNHSFNVEIANEYGVEKAIIVENIAFWVKKNSVNSKHFHDGKNWTYNSAKAFSELFPYWNTKKINRLLNDLVKDGALISGNYNKVRFDQTKWYTIAKDSICQKYDIHFSDLENGVPESGNSEFPDLENGVPKNEKPIPDINTGDNPDNKPNTPQTPQGESVPPQKKGAQKERFGSFKNVLLTQDEKKKLIEKFGFSSAKERVENLSLFVESTGRKYKSHYATILAWDRRDNANKQITEKGRVNKQPTGVFA